MKPSKYDFVRPGFNQYIWPVTYAVGNIMLDCEPAGITCVIKLPLCSGVDFPVHWAFHGKTFEYPPVTHMTQGFVISPLNACRMGSRISF